jgi:predicted nucleotidyltransferase
MTLEQEKTIEMVKIDAKQHKFILGLILFGSLAKNTGNEGSDVDLMIVLERDM